MKTTHSRTYFTAMIIFLISLLLLGAALQILVSDRLESNAYEKLEQQAQVLSELASAYEAQGSMVNMQFIMNVSITSRSTDCDTVICDRTGRIVLCSDSVTGCDHQGLMLDQEYMKRVIANGISRDKGRINGLYGQQRYVVALPIYSSGSHLEGLVMVSTPTAATAAMLQQVSRIFLSAAVLIVVFSVLAMAGFSRYQGGALREMAKTASAFGHGDLDARVHITGSEPEDVRDLAIAFNNMASSLQKSEYQRQEFVANVSHELKTPMTTIGGYIDGILDGTIPPEKSRHYMRIVSDETKRLSRLVRSMLDISQLQGEGGIPDEKKSRFDTAECIGQMLITFEQKILSKNLGVDVDFPDHPLYTVANRDAISQVVYNLIDNAVKFCPEEGTLSVRLREGGSKIYVSIANTGETIPADQLPLVFDRFHKLDKSRSQNRDGWGLGLYIVKTIVCSHGEDISVTSKDGKTTFTFTLPLVN